MAAHRPPDRVEAASDQVQEFLFGAAYSRRRFLVYSAAGAAGSFLSNGAPAGVGTVVSPPSGGINNVIQPTPSWYFIHRENGSEEMKWGPVGRAVFDGEVGYGEFIPNDRFYIHNRARPPNIDRRTWRLKLTGDAITRPRSFTFEELLALPQVTLRRTLDCGANCSAFYPKLPPTGADNRWLPVAFTQWHFGAVGAAEWTGVRVKDVLAAAGADHPMDVKLTGLDVISSPSFPNGKGNYSEVIPADTVLKDDTLLVYRMNGSDLPIDHGYPLRLLVSGWGGNIQVKWLGEIQASKQPIPVTGPAKNQVLTGPGYPKPVRPTVGRVRSAIEHSPDLTLMPGDITLHGRAWSGAAAIEGVDVAVERLVMPGRWVSQMPWRPAKLLSTPEPLLWVRFEVLWPGVKPGQYRVMSRAKDKAGNIQPRPEDVVWNQHGLGYNGHYPLDLIVVPAGDMP
ncbi:MAG: putative sulfite oxidase [Actinomycetia bacterium]|nr:putative sulfite oxidase [Actinomycetes bacterium]